MNATCTKWLPPTLAIHGMRCARCGVEHSIHPTEPGKAVQAHEMTKPTLAGELKK